MLGCLIEKEATVPDAYPLTLNSLRQACNQSSNRDPIVSYDDLTIQRCVDRLKTLGFVRFVHPSHGERVTRFRHVVDERLVIDRGSLALLGVLALRGPQTSGELRSRTERLHDFGAIGYLEAALTALAEREDPLVVQLPRVPGQHQTRWCHLLAGPVDLDAVAAGVPRTRTSATNGVGDRVATLEAEVADLRDRLARIENALGIEEESVDLVGDESEDDTGQ